MDEGDTASMTVAATPQQQTDTNWHKTQLKRAAGRKRNQKEFQQDGKVRGNSTNLAARRSGATRQGQPDTGSSMNQEAFTIKQEDIFFSWGFLSSVLQPPAINCASINNLKEKNLASFERRARLSLLFAAGPPTPQLSVCSVWKQG